MRIASLRKELEQAQMFSDAFGAALEIPFEPKPLPAFPEMPPIDGACAGCSLLCVSLSLLCSSGVCLCSAPPLPQRVLR